jgi:phospholipid/cholesterol/gamma-HCH transport system substrate-binding protein
MVRTLDTLLKDNKPQIARLIVNVDSLSKEASQLLGSIRAGVGDASTLKGTLANLEALTSAIRKDIDPLLAKTKRALDGVNNLTSVVGPNEKDKLVKALEQLLQITGRVHSIASDAQVVVADIKKGRGTAGALLVDQQIYDDLKELVRDLKRNPWKFFWKE